MNLKRTKRQIQAVNKWIENDYKGTLEFATGVGKTITAIIAIKKLFKKKLVTVHIVVPTKYLKTQWEKELKKHDLFGYTDTYVYVINTYVKEERECDLLILDEIHNYGSPNRIKIFNFKYKKLLGLTATIERKDLLHNVILTYAPIVDRINLEEARLEGYVSDYMIYNLGIELSDRDKMYYMLINKEFHKHFAVFGRDFNLAMSCMSDKNARERYARLSGMKENEVGFHAVRFNKYMQERKNFLYDLDSKLVAAREIIYKFKLKTITFSENTATTDKLTVMIDGSVAYHSKIPKKKRNENLKEFQESKVNVCNTSKALDEGFDVGDIEMAIITSSRAVERVDRQRVKCLPSIKQSNSVKT